MAVRRLLFGTPLSGVVGRCCFWIGMGKSDAMAESAWPPGNEAPTLLLALLGGDTSAVRSSPVVSTSSDQFRIVYFTSDGVTIDELAVFRRPPRFDGVDGGRVIVVNGPSGSGKSSLLAAIAANSSLPWVILDEPVLGTVDQGYLIWRGQAPGLHRGFLDAVAALASADNLVAFSAAGHPAALIDDAFDGVEVVRIGLDCDLDTLMQRERGREGRSGGLAAASITDHDGWRYDARFDTSQLSATVIARHVLTLLRIPEQ